jgi:energy-coupling factor transporter transmembrane protein EcfT
MSGSRYNPLVRVALTIAGLLAVSLARDWLQFGYVVAVFLVLCAILRARLSPMARSIKVILPWTFIFFIIHMTFSKLAEPQVDLMSILKSEAIVLFRFIGLAGAMGVLREGVSAESLVDSIKTLIDRLGIKSHLAEDLLQTMRLILIFIPEVMREYRSIERFDLALGFDAPVTLRERVSFYGGNLLPVVSRSLSRARQLGEVMNLRGYGKFLPRGQLSPLPFRTRDGLAVSVITVLLGSVLWVF